MNHNYGAFEEYSKGSCHANSVPQGHGLEGKTNRKSYGFYPSTVKG